MIARYTRKEMAQLWTDEYRFQKMFEVECFATEALVRKGMVPAKALATIRKKAKINVSRIHEIEKTVKHDVIAFVSQVVETIGPEGRYLHMGLTSSDVLDTALAVQMKEAADLLIQDIDRLKAAIKKIAKKHENTL
jgi:adenylosuccinate lyase